ncbi:MAG: division/cell wall cluster transcriptional repressor MraZ [Bacteroidetes bacterium]|nr:division/cell wall cluster transcriptional repressor MraZ [Bacteroidota bacterium]
MSQFQGEFECKLDAKGRLSLPSALRKQMAPEAKEKFMVNRGFENCLALYPMDEWQKISDEINNLNMYVVKNREFARYFFRGAMELELDAAGRILLPKRMLEHAGVSKELVLYGWGNKIEIWSVEGYAKLLKDEPKDFAALAEEVMGKINLNRGGGGERGLS